MKTELIKYSPFNKFIFSVFIILTVLVPVSFYPEFINKYDLVKASVLYFAGGIFFVFTSLYFTCISIIELELGNEKESRRIKSEIFKTDTCQFVYRINLATYYLNHNRCSEAVKEIDLVLHYDIKNIDALSAKAYYLQQTKNYKETAVVCREILDINPNNKFAKSMFAWLKENDK